MARVYVSSTVTDLQQERRAVMEWLVAAGHQPVHSYRPDSETVRDSCLDDVNTCDLYVVIIGHRYGFQPEESNPEGLSITQLEFRRAGQSGKPRVALLRTSIPDVSLSDMENPERAARLLAFREEVAHGVRPALFDDKGGLIQGLSTGVQAELAKHSAVAEQPSQTGVQPGFEAERAEYLARVQQRYQRMDLEVLTPLTEQGEHPAMLLDEVFVPPLVRADPPPVELPRELWRRLAEAGEVRAEDLPEGVDRKRVEQVRLAFRQRPPVPVLEVVAGAAGRRLVLLGDPGAGKSSLARYLMLALAANPGQAPAGALAGLAGWLPLLVELRVHAAWGRGDSTFLDLIDNLHATQNMGLPRPLLEKFLQHGGRALVIFDGLDEIFDPGLREQAALQIEGFAARYPQARVLVTSRVIGYQRSVLDAAGFTHYLLQDFDLARIQTFTAAWYRSSCPDEPGEAGRLRERLLAAVRDSAAVAELASNPMLLTILAIIGRRQQLPRDRRAVYEHAVSVLAEHWDAGKHLPGGPDFLAHEDKLELLRLVARRMQDAPDGLAGNYLPGDQLRAQFEAYLRQRFELPASQAAPAAKAMLDQLRERNFILARFGAGVYGFVHRAFLDFLAAADISQQFADHELPEEQLAAVFSGHWDDPAWQEVLLLITGMIPARFAGQMIALLLGIDPLWQFRRRPHPGHLLLALRCLAEVRKPGEITAQSHAAVTALISLLETAASSGPPGLVQDLEAAALPAVTGLGSNWAGRARYQHWYLAVGQHPDRFAISGSQVGLLAARLHTALFPRDNHAHRSLRTTATLASNPGLRQAAVQAIAGRWADDPDTLPWLRHLATINPDETVRLAAVQAIAAGWADAPDTLPLLRDIATTDPDGYVRLAAVQAIVAGWADDPDTLPWLRHLATTDQHRDVRQAAVVTIAARLADDPETVSLLRDIATTDSDGYVRQATVQAIGSGWADDPDTLPWLRELAATSPDRDVRVAAVQAIGSGWADDPETLAWLRHLAIAAGNETVRQAAVQAIAERWADDPDTLPWLRHLATTDHHPTVGRAAVVAIAARWADDPDTLPLLRNIAITDPDKDVRQATVQAIAERWADHADTVPLLHDRATTDQHPAVRRAAVVAIAAGWADDSDSLPLLRNIAITDPDEYVRQATVQAIAAEWANAPDTLPWLRQLATTDQHPTVRQAAVVTIAAGWADDPDSLPLLRNIAITDQHPTVRQVAVHAIAAGWIDHPGTLPWLCELATTNQHPTVRESAVQTIAARWADNPNTLPMLRGATRDPDGYVRLAAVVAIAAGWADDPDTLPRLRELAATDPDRDVRLAAVQAIMTRWADHPDTQPLLRGLAATDPQRDVRLATVQAIMTRWADHPDTLPLMRELAVGDPDRDVRLAAVQAVMTRWADHPDAQPLLRELAATSPDSDVRLATVQAIMTRWADHPDTQPLLRELATTSPDRDVRLATVQAIAAGWADAPDALPLLHNIATTDTDEDVRLAAVQAIGAGWADHPDTEPWLRGLATTDKHQDVRVAAVQTIAARWAEHPDTLPLLRNIAITDHIGYVREATVQAIAAGWAEHPDTLPWLRGLATTDRHQDVRLAAVQAIAAGWADDPDTTYLLRNIANTDPDEVVRLTVYMITISRPRQLLAHGFRGTTRTHK